ncbi:SRPBCC family protein [Actinoplanes oblitus]|uniref:SRPBCC family protein n=1 Tax=Actinoplanes oblitus TaxID=3040509 RepID=A0ABY8WR67_9ACTN|nr:SRPBCC family protein [Actinoplanes oblitus]WIN00387.1 SRPBCC family protein [Actinoplanes oblitus]
MAKVTVEADAKADPQRVWDVVADLSRVAEWNTMHEGFTGEVPSHLGEGTEYRQRVKLMGMPAEMAWRVVTAAAPTRLEQNGDGPMGVKAKNLIVIEKAEGGSHITYEMEFIGPALKGPMAGMLEKQAGAAGQQALAKLVALAE